MRGRRRLLIAVALTGLIVAAGCGAMVLDYQKKSDALWTLVSEKCVPNQLQYNDPTPCRVVNSRNGYVVLKDRNGPLQYLLLPLEKITGIESPELLNPSTPNFVAEAWRARHFMTERRGMKVEDSAVALSVNSQTGRTQNQLHIHISCLRPDIRQRLNTLDSSLTATWRPVKLGVHEYQIRAVTRDEIKRMSAFIRIANEIPGARDDMGSYSFAVAALSNGRRALMVVRRNLLLLNRASAEELQDHSCQLLSEGVKGSSAAP